MTKKYRDISTIEIRLQPELQQKIKMATAAGKEKNPKWSRNSEIEHRLMESFATRLVLDRYTDGELIDELIKRWGREAVSIRLGTDK